jgi:hypothetical protein
MRCASCRASRSPQTRASTAWPRRACCATRSGPLRSAPPPPACPVRPSAYTCIVGFDVGGASHVLAVRMACIAQHDPGETLHSRALAMQGLLRFAQWLPCSCCRG